MLSSAFTGLWKFIRLQTVNVLLGNLLQQNKSWTQASIIQVTLDESHKDGSKIN